MSEQKKVIAALSECNPFNQCYEERCPYYKDNNCLESLHEDALKLLKKHEPVRPNAWVPKGQTMARVRGYYCPVCDTSVAHGDRFCHWCGRELTWDE